MPDQMPYNNNGQSNTNGQSTAAESDIEKDKNAAKYTISLKLSNLEKINNRFLTSLNELHTDNAELKAKVDSLESRLNWQQQHLLINFIEIVGVPNVNDKNAIDKTKQFFHNALSIDVPDEKIEKCYVRKVRSKEPNNSSAY